MSGDLVNAFGKISLDETSKDISELLVEILVELNKINIHLAVLSDEKISDSEVQVKGE